MARSRSFFPPFLVLAASLSASGARAGAPDPRTLRDQLEEQVLDGDKDTEDLAVLHASATTPHGTHRAGTAYVALAAFVGEHSERPREYGAMLVLQLPLERFAGARRFALPRAEAVSVGGAFEETQAGRASDRPRTMPLVGLLQSAGDGAPSPEAAPSAPPSKNPVVITMDVARACVRAAWRAVGLADDAAIDAMAARARSSAALPELRLRAMRTIDESGRVTLSDADPYRYTETGGATNWLEARLTFRLDRLIFADDEVSLERVRLERSEIRARTAAKVMQTLFEWQRAYALVLEPSLSSAEHFAAILRELEASAILDVMTDGYFGRFRASTGRPP
jgi:hypothetical protein